MKWILKWIRVTMVAVLAGGASCAAIAQSFTIKNVFLGGGLSRNEISGSDSATGVQAFGGYAFGEFAPRFYLDAEAGYMNSGNMRLRPSQATVRARGPWTTGVARYLVVPNIELLARAGVDLGDDDGPMFGIGAGFLASRNLKFRVEFVARDDVDSLQFNVVVFPWR